MPDNLSSAPDNSPDALAAERAAACAVCETERDNLIAEIGIVEADTATETAPELSEWAEASFPNLEPRDLLIAAVQVFQDEERAFDLAYDVTTEYSADIAVDIQLLMDRLTAQQRNGNTGAQIEDGVPAKVPAEAGKESTLIVEEGRLEADRKEMVIDQKQKRIAKGDRLESRAEKSDRNAEIKQLQSTFDTFRSKGTSTIDALRQVIAQAENPETKRHLNVLLQRINLLQIALPEKPEVVTRLLNSTGLDLSANTVAGSFAGFMTAAENDDALTDTDLATLRQIIHKEETYVRTGTQVQTELGQTHTDKNGQTVPTHPANDPLKFRLNVIGFAEADGSQKLRATTVHGERVTLDITGWSGADIGRASELLQLWAMTENEGQTDYLTSLTKLKWTDTAKIDTFSLQYASQVVSAILGGGEGHDGDIFDGKEALGMVRWQAQLANQKGGTVRGNRDAGRTDDVLVDLGIRDKVGNLDLDALKAFGEYSRENWNVAADFENMQRELIKIKK